MTKLPKSNSQLSNSGSSVSEKFNDSSRRLKDSNNSSVTAMDEEHKIDYASRGDEYKAQNRFSMAIEQYKEALLKHKSYDILKSLSECYVKESRHDDALKTATEMIKLNKRSVESHQNAIDALKKLAEESLEELFVDKAIEYAKDVRFFNEQDNPRVSIIKSSTAQIDELMKLKHRIRRDNKMQKLRVFELKITNIFDKKEYDSSIEETAKIHRLKQIFIEKVNKQMKEIELEYNKAIGIDLRPIPDYYTCPITYELMEKPVSANDKYTYEEGEFLDYINNYNDHSPMNRETIHRENIFPNKALKRAIEDFKNTA